MFRWISMLGALLTALILPNAMLSASEDAADAHAGDDHHEVELPYVEAPGDAGAGESLATPCQACHGAGGISVMPEWPSLAGQNYKYLLRQLRMIKTNERMVPTMAGQLDAIDDDGLKDLAAYFAAQPAPLLEADDEPTALELGARIYRAGLPRKGVAACSACHSAKGGGNEAAGFPALSGQHAAYTVLQLKAYRDGDRATDETFGGMMRGVAANLNDREIEAIANYVSGLH